MSNHEEKASYQGGKSSNNNSAKYGVILVSALVICGISFWSGTAYQKGKQSNVTANASNNLGPQTMGVGNSPGGFGGGQGGPGNGQQPNIGEVTAISSNSITVSDSRSNSKKVFKISSKTSIQNNGSTVSVSEVKNGDTALVITDSSDASTASQIMLNPSFNAPQQPNGN